MAKKLSGYEKTAIFLMTLGEDIAAEIMKNLDPKEIRLIGNIISRLSDVPQEEVDAVLTEFSENAEGGYGLSLEGKDYIQKVLTKALGNEKATRVMENLHVAEEGGIETLKWMDPRNIAAIIRNEHPQMIALILTHLETDQSGQILMQLPPALRSDVLLRMGTLEEIPPGIMKEVSEILKTELSRVGTTAGQRVGGINLVADILNKMDQAAEQQVMDKISQANAELADQIRQLMFVFDDLIKLDDRSMQEILKEVAKEQLAVALKAAKEEIKEKIFKNMSARAAQILKEDMESMGPVKLSDVEKNQMMILTIVRKLEEEGRVVVPGKGEGEVLV